MLAPLASGSELLAPTIRITNSRAELDACLRLRREVFIDEQGVPAEDEIDDLDPVCVHFLALPEATREGGSPTLADAIGTARLWPTPAGEAKAQRVAVAPSARGHGVGRALMAALEEEARARGYSEVVLGAQLSAVSFYEPLGYQAYGDVFDDAGIPHRMMKKHIR